MILGYATLNGTGGFFKKFDLPHRHTEMFSTTPIAMGTHLGDMTEAVSELYREGLAYALEHGINFIDTAINYRGMRSERDIGYVLKNWINDKERINRENIVVSSKAGIIPGDVEAKLVPKDYLQKVLLENGIVQDSDLNIVETHRHVLAPTYFEFAIGESMKHLNLQTIDIYYVHNPEISMMVLGPDTFYKKLEKLFLFLEEQVQVGNIKNYGLATWVGLLNNPDEAGYISLERVVKTAERVAGKSHHFKFIQFPLNKRINEGTSNKNQRVNGKWQTVVEAAEELGIYATTSAPFNLGNDIDDGKKPEKALMDIINTKGILSTMVGMKSIKHIKENIEIIRANDWTF